MGRNRRGVRDGSGPYRGSYRRRGEGKSIGRRKARLGYCPYYGLKRA